MKKHSYWLCCLLSFLLLNACEQDGFLSEEMLSQLELLDSSLSMNNSMIQQSIKQTLFEIEQTSLIKTQFIPLVTKIKEISLFTEEFITYVDSLKLQIAQKTDSLYFVENRIQQLKHKRFSLIENLWTGTAYNGTIFAEKSLQKQFLKKLKKELIWVQFDSYNSTVHQNMSWSEFTFANKSPKAILVILRQLQNDALRTAFIIINQLANQLRFQTICGGGYFQLFASASKTSIRLGETYEADITLGFIDPDTNFSIVINNKPLHISGGKTLYKTTPTSVGQQQYTAKVSITNPLTGEIQTFTKDFYYDVMKE